MAELQKRDITKRIRQARQEAGLTQPQMADVLDVAGRTYQNYEDDRVPWALMGRISDVTGRSLRWLLHGEDDAEPSMEIMQRIGRLEISQERIEAKLDALARHVGMPDEADRQAA
jgi:transcriptional regulator with XRE-family HTH domain